MFESNLKVLTLLSYVLTVSSHVPCGAVGGDEIVPVKCVCVVLEPPLNPITL